jgi:hypothetical protein
MGTADDLDQSDIDALAQDRRAARWLNAFVACAIVVAGAALVLVRPGREPQLALALGSFFLVLGTAMGFWVWRGDWSVPDAARFTRGQARVRAMGTLWSALELLLLTLALLGLLFPAQFGSYWRDHRVLVTIAGVGLAVDLVHRSARAMSAQRLRAAEREGAQ